MDFTNYYIPFDHPKFKYKIIKPYEIYTKIKNHFVQSSFIVLHKDGTLLFQRNYTWDGPSGPALDTPNFMRGSLVHDGLYQLIREKHLNIYRKKYADKLLRDICLEDGMNIFRAYYVYYAVKWFGTYAAKLEG